MKPFPIILAFVLVVSVDALSQVASPGANDLYQYNYTTVSPAFAGVDGEKMTFMGTYSFPTSAPIMVRVLLATKHQSKRSIVVSGLTLAHYSKGT